jgi:hypothetical protein
MRLSRDQVPRIADHAKCGQTGSDKKSFHKSTPIWLEIPVRIFVAVALA